MEVAKECELMKKVKNVVQSTLDDRDFEVACDSLASTVGVLFTVCDEEDPSRDLIFVCEMLYHLSASLRESYCLTDWETQRIIELGRKYDEHIVDPIVLPISYDIATSFSHQARVKSREIILMLRKFSEVETIDNRLFDVFDSLANYFFGYAMYRSLDEESYPFKSRVY